MMIQIQALALLLQAAAPAVPASPTPSFSSATTVVTPAPATPAAPLPPMGLPPGAAESATVVAPVTVVIPAAHAPEPKHDSWTDHITLRGYTQLRYDRAFADTTPGMRYEFGDKGLTGPASFTLRRVRLALLAKPTDRVTVYLQPDFAGAIAGDTMHVLAARDAWAALAIGADKEFTLRSGLLKVPYGWENIQSSQNRIALDRSESINTAAPGERDIGAFLFYTPKEVHERFDTIMKLGLKGSNDWGLASIGVANGQGINLIEKNSTKTAYARLSLPFLLGGSQWAEVGVAGYYGTVAVTRGDKIFSRQMGGTNDNFDDARGLLSLNLFPQPFGVQIEANYGTGPELDGTFVQQKDVYGGYCMLSYRIAELPGSAGQLIPYARGSYYRGGHKLETNVGAYKVTEFEGGIEWTPVKNAEFTVAYLNVARTLNGTDQRGDWVRLQAQFSY